MEIIGFIVLAIVLLAGAWYCCRAVDSRPRNTGGQHGGGINGAREGVDMVD